MSTEMNSNLCAEVEDAMASILDGTASAALYDHVAECDACRDRKHDATIAAQHILIAGGDFRAPEGFADALLARIDEQRPDGPAGARTSGVTKSNAPSAPIEA